MKHGLVSTWSQTCVPCTMTFPLCSRCAGEWARAVAMVSQEPVLFSGSIADNIAYGKFGRCSQAEIQAAAEAANAHEFIMELPDGYNTLVGDRGTLLSGEASPRLTWHRLYAGHRFTAKQPPSWLNVVALAKLSSHIISRRKGAQAHMSAEQCRRARLYVLLLLLK